ncbi:kynurenine 3-monooxygenase isoform X1 [Episyrphus balteatus]|uniref:kynurenine 3-monooxygenase isoform X1 n=2 Tax=Episyrphus balteatus TaxID=286459 RepID=UPI0024868B45|nr:kynurenine 3-monooxygenase isoform X1 [Episyrphus balteatus]
MKVAVIGAGLVGSLAALNLAKKGHEVHLYEYRGDSRGSEITQGRSINLALSQRGRKALAAVGLEDEVLKTAIPMKGRMLHDLKGNTTVVIYDSCNHQCLYSVGRKYLNEILLNKGEQYENIHLHFQHKLVTANLTEGTMQFNRNYSSTEIVNTEADLIIGCDGAFSAVRNQMIKVPGFNYTQEYIEHGYLELCIPAKNGEFQMPENYLHIWPRGSYMMIALPNQDKSFTVTLSMPFTVFSTITDADSLIEFFETNYCDALPLIGKEKLIKDFFKSKPQHLVSIKCYPYHNGKSLLIGDAAHAMVPYYGQGMNAGFEDCSVLFSIFEQPNLAVEEVLKQFTETRWQDAHAICDLAMYNYVVMRDLTKRFSFRCRKVFDDLLYTLFPNFWVPLYNSVSFTNMPYRKCIENRKWQDKALHKTFIVLGSLTALIGISYAAVVYVPDLISNGTIRLSLK